MATVLKAPNWRLGINMRDVVCKSQRRKPVPVGTIYFIGPREGMVKIGFTTDLQARLKRLQTASPVPLYVIAAIPDQPATLEREYHARFHSCREHGEWFLRTIDVDAEIVRLIAQGGPHD